jgi:hypothetical protein
VDVSEIVACTILPKVKMIKMDVFVEKIWIGMLVVINVHLIAVK